MLFFLFKQKTAYEMRISDWSSDVCSSDLHEPYILDPYATDPAEIDIDIAVDREGTATGIAARPARITAKPVPVPYQHQDEDRPRDTRQSDSDPLGDAHGISRPARSSKTDTREAVPEAGDGACALRSEHQTSELQSLMRKY